MAESILKAASPEQVQNRFLSGYGLRLQDIERGLKAIREGMTPQRQFCYSERSEILDSLEVIQKQLGAIEALIKPKEQ